MEFNKLVSIIGKYVSDNRGNDMSSTDIAELIIKDNKDISESLQYISLMVYEEMSKEDDPALSSDKVIEFRENSETRYSVIDDHYVWESRKAGSMCISVTDADRIFYEYSRFGLNMDQEEVRNKHGLSIPQWNSLKSTLFLYKSSNIFSQHTCDNTRVEDLQAMISDKMDMKFNDKNRVLEHEYRKHTIKEYKKVIRKFQVSQFASTEFLHQLNTLMPQNETITVYRNNNVDTDVPELLVTIADLHIGARTEGLRKTPDFNESVLERRLSSIAQSANALKSGSVSVCILGEIRESFSGLNHSNSWQNMEYGAYGADVVFSAYGILSKFLDSINNLKTVKIIGGNHDRSSSDNGIDRKADIAKLIFFLLKEKYNHVYNIEFDSLVLTHDMRDTRFILAHGDKKVIRKSSNGMDSKILEYGDNKKFNVVLTGHLHSRGVNEDKVHCRWYSVPSVFSGNFYSEENGWNSRPGFFLVHEDPATRLPKIIDCPLN
jgi:predicted phosphodiesterase